MQSCVASATQTVLLIINRILKREKTIHEVPRNRGRKISDFHKTVNGQLAEICKVGKKFTNFG